MEQNSGGQNQNQSFFRKYMVSIAIALIVFVGALYFSAQNNEETQNGDVQEQEQNAGENNEQNQDSGQNDNGQQQTSPPPSSQESSGNVAASGTLRESDNPARGNLMVERPSGNVYVSTQRDFSSLIGQNVTLNAEGTLNSFRFLGFNGHAPATPSPSPIAGVDTEARGGASDEEETGAVTFSGTMMDSDNETRGNYMIVSESSKIYLKSVRDYSSFVGSDVTLTASGTIDNFTGAVVVKN